MSKTIELGSIKHDLLGVLAQSDEDGGHSGFCDMMRTVVSFPVPRINFGRISYRSLQQAP
jgi:hypothetical protein